MELLKAKYCLLYWYHEERNWSVQTTSAIKWPLRDPESYQKGMLVMARFQGKLYRAAIIRVKDEKDDLIEDKIKLDGLLKDSSLTPKMVCEQMDINVDLDVDPMAVKEKEKVPLEAAERRKKNDQAEKKKDDDEMKSKDDAEKKSKDGVENKKRDDIEKKKKERLKLKDEEILKEKSLANIAEKLLKKPKVQVPQSSCSQQTDDMVCLSDLPELSSTKVKQTILEVPNGIQCNCRKEMIEFKEEIRRLKRRVRDLEKASTSLENPSTEEARLPQPDPPQKKMKDAECDKSGSVASTCTLSSAASSEQTDSQSVYKGYTENGLLDAISHIDSLYECVHHILLLLFPLEYIITHSVTGQKPNSTTPSKPKFDGRLYGLFLRVIKNKFNKIKDTEITSKVQTVQKKYRKQNLKKLEQTSI